MYPLHSTKSLISYKSLPQINVSLIYTAGESFILLLMYAGLRLNTGPGLGLA